MSNLSEALKRRKVKKVMSEFEAGELSIGKSDKKVTNRRQAIAISMKMSGQSKKGKK